MSKTKRPPLEEQAQNVVLGNAGAVILEACYNNNFPKGEKIWLHELEEHCEDVPHFDHVLGVLCSKGLIYVGYVASEDLHTVTVLPLGHLVACCNQLVD